MKNYKKTLLTSLAAIGVSCALIGGATFAIFTSESTTNIAVTSGKVDVRAEVIDEIKLSSMGKEMTETFEVGGTAEYDAATNSFTIDGMVAGDYIDFDIKITNNSTVDVKYQTSVSYTGDKVLFDALDFTIGDLEFIDSGNSACTYWTDLEVGSAEMIKHVKMGIPETYEDKIVNGDDTDSVQGKNCSITFKVTAVQANATVNNPELAIRTAVVAGVGQANSGLEDIDIYGARFNDLEYVADNDAWESTLNIDFDGAIEDIIRANGFDNAQEVTTNHMLGYLAQIVYKVIDVINYAVDEEVENIYSIQIDEQDPRVFNGAAYDDEWWLQNDLLEVAGEVDLFGANIAMLWETGFRVPVKITGMDKNEVTYALTILVSGVPEDFLG